jgi:hypothetical protein
MKVESLSYVYQEDLGVDYMFKSSILIEPPPKKSTVKLPSWSHVIPDLNEIRRSISDGTVSVE